MGSRRRMKKVKKVYFRAIPPFLNFRVFSHFRAIPTFFKDTGGERVFRSAFPGSGRKDKKVKKVELMRERSRGHFGTTSSLSGFQARFPPLINGLSVRQARFPQSVTPSTVTVTSVIARLSAVTGCLDGCRVACWVWYRAV